MILFTPHPDGVILPVRAQPGASRAGIRGEHNGILKVAVTQVAEKGKANKALIAAIASDLNLNRSQVELIAGESQREKKFLIRGISPEDLQKRIAPFVEASEDPPVET